jgi:hypothetical protein
MRERTRDVVSGTFNLLSANCGWSGGDETLLTLKNIGVPADGPPFFIPFDIFVLVLCNMVVGVLTLKA